MIAKGDVLAMVRQVLKEGQTAVDVGAAEGTVCEVMRECVGPTGTVIAIEPRATAIGYGVIRHRVACGAHPGTKTLYVPPDGGERAGFYKDAVFTKGETQPLEVPVVPLDALVDRADLVKIDVQGAELSVLDGAKRLLLTCPNWILEVWPHGLLCSGRSLQELWNRVHKFGLIPHAQHGPAIDYDELSRWSMDRSTPGPFINWLCKRAS